MTRKTGERRVQDRQSRLSARLSRYLRARSARQGRRRPEGHGRRGSTARQQVFSAPRWRATPSEPTIRSACSTAAADRQEGRRTLRANLLGRGDRDHRRRALGASPPRIPRASCRTATPAPWGSCRANRCRNGSFTGSARASSTAPSAPRPVRPATRITLGREHRHGHRGRGAMRSSSFFGDAMRSPRACISGRARKRRSAAARGSSPSTRIVRSPRRNATSTSHSCRGPTARSRSA